MSKIEDIREKEEYTPKDKAFIGTCIFGIVVFMGLLILRFTVNPIFVSGSSMYPTYHDGQLVTTRTHFTRNDIDYDDVIIFHLSKSSKDYYIKRVVGLPGDTITINEDGFFRNGEPVVDDFQKMGNGYQTVVLGEDEYFVLGDNRNNSNDSRVFGAVNYNLITRIVRK